MDDPTSSASGLWNVNAIKGKPGWNKDKSKMGKFDFTKTLSNKSSLRK